MQDTELYRYVLGLEEPWNVERVKLDVSAVSVDIMGRPGGRSAVAVSGMRDGASGV